ncbi:MAG: class I SAM-dependent methyltransferase [Chthoniobacterales bacterium]
MQPEIMDRDLPSRHFDPRIYGVGAWTRHLHFGYDLVATLKPATFVELGVDRGESYFAFCQAAAEHRTGTRCFGIDTWQGDAHAGSYDETTFRQVAAHNRTHYATFSTLVRMGFDDALEDFELGSIDLLHLDALHTEAAVRHDVESWLPKLREGGILLLHDVGVRTRDFRVWKVWDELRDHGRSYAFTDGPGLGVWEKPPIATTPALLEDLFSQSDDAVSLAQYYRRRAQQLQEKIASHWRDGTIRQTAFAQQTIVQIFYSADGTHREEDSVHSRVGHYEWKDVAVVLPQHAKAAPLRVDFVSALTEIQIASVRIKSGEDILFAATELLGFEALQLAGDIEKLADTPVLRLRITGVDPQIYLPPLPAVESDDALVVQLRLRVVAAPRT